MFKRAIGTLLSNIAFGLEKFSRLGVIMSSRAGRCLAVLLWR